MPEFSDSSKAKLATCNPELQMIFNYVIKYLDCTIVCGYRDKEAQDKAFKDRFSKVKFPDSKHNKHPSNAVDCIPYPSLYSDKDKLIELGGFVKGIAKMLLEYGQIDYEIIWGGNWNWKDYPHYQLRL